MKLGDLIKLYRNNNDMTMQEFAGRAGLSKGYISMLERNRHPQNRRELVPSFETYEKVATAMGMTLDELISVLDENENIKLNATSSSSSPAPLQLSDQEERLVITYRQLNDDGQSKLLEYGDDLVASGRYGLSELEAQMWKDADEIAQEEYENAARLKKHVK